MSSSHFKKTANLHLWLIVIIFAVCTFLHYPDLFSHVPSLKILTLLGFERHALVRILFLAPIIYAVFQFGIPGGVVSLSAALIIMLPRVIFISKFPKDALFETITTAVIGSLIVVWFASRQRALLAKETSITSLEAVQNELQRVGERFKEIFEKANDAIWLQDISGTILLANSACTIVTGYEKNELMKKNSYELFLPSDSADIKLVQQSLLGNRPVKQPYEQKILKKKETVAEIMLTSSLLGDKQFPTFLHIARDITEERSLQRGLRAYSQQISKAHEEERKRIARDLHDDTIQTLVGISRMLDNFISQQNRLSGEALTTLEAVKTQTDDAVKRTRNFIQNLRPPILEYLGLVPALRELADSMKEQSGIAILFISAGSEEALAPEEKLLVYRIAQEAIWNVMKYSQATEVEIAIHFDNSKLTLSIHDNGIGFIQKKDEELLGEGKLGLIGMMERAMLLRGTLDITSSPGKGSTVQLIV